MNNDDTDHIHHRLWHDNQALVLLPGLCPLLLASTSVVNALALALATLVVLTMSSLLLSLCRRLLLPAIQLPVSMLVFAVLTTCTSLLMQAWLFELHQRLGLFIGLIASNWILVGHAEGSASRQPPLAATIAGLMTGCRLLPMLVAVGVCRELLGTGAVFADLQQLLPFATDWKLQVFETDAPFLLAILPPGALLAAGLLLALKNVIDKKPARPAAVTDAVVAGSKRVRVTGQI